jgi:hypothetical protein
MAYYSYLWLKKPGVSENLFNYLVISADRNTADTLFRVLDENRSLVIDSSNVVNIKELNRESSQIWTYDCDDNELPYRVNRIVSGSYPLEHNQAPSLRDLVGKVKIVQMSVTNTVGKDPTGWKMLPELHLGVDDDRLSGYSFYVRRRGSPDAFWYNDGGVISLSQHKRSRFIVTVQTRHRVPKIPIIAKDKVEVQWVDVDSTRALDVSKGFLALSLGETEVLYFSDFLQRFSIVYSDSAQSGDLMLTPRSPGPPNRGKIMTVLNCARVSLLANWETWMTTSNRLQSVLLECAVVSS